MRRAAALLVCVALLWAAPVASAAPVREPAGWAGTGTGTTGGAGGTTWTVRTRAELKEALGNRGDPTAPKVIRIGGAINGHEADDGSLLGEQDYAPGYDLAKYMSCFGEDGAEWSDIRHDHCRQQRQLRQAGSAKEKAQIQLTVPSNTTLVGVGDDARLLGVFLDRVDARRVAALGFSMGAYRAWQTAALSDDIAAAVSVGWMTGLKEMMVSGNNTLRGQSSYYMVHPGLARHLDFPDVASIAAPRPMLFLNGGLDPLFPADGVRAAHAELRAVWRSCHAEERLRLRTWPDLGHVFTAPMQDEVFDWLDTVRLDSAL
ncbi:dienelactone hydrolase family protein [Streptomyces sp. AS02]|uniref:dienelactone hydrolase family protein n=1 Tax=Streptomyces sp. AS02 TaxID=2938946 RepID=UPI002020DB4E|nr:alpha/beta hydrolase family protein [Streptomyces sp. AS02]MCL8010832.1 hypothetical protein [Streptomyces sp. AS02]